MVTVLSWIPKDRCGGSAPRRLLSTDALHCSRQRGRGERKPSVGVRRGHRLVAETRGDVDEGSGSFARHFWLSKERGLRLFQAVVFLWRPVLFFYGHIS